MTAIDINLRTKIIAPSQNVWVIWPGRGRRYFDYFKTNGRIFLELPGTLFKTELGKLQGKAINKRETTKLIRRNVARSFDYIDWANHARTINPPSANIDTYAEVPKIHKSRFSQMMGCARKLIAGMKVGDLVICPGSGILSETLIGEVTHEFDENDTLRVAPFEYAEIQYRRVKWLRNDIIKKDFSPGLIKYVSKPPAISLLPQIGMHSEVYDFAYETYILGENSRALIFGDPKPNSRPSSVNGTNYLVDFLIAAYSRIEANDLDALRNIDDIDVFIETYFDPQLVENYSLHFSSKGQIGLRARNAALSTFITVNVALASSCGLSACKDGTVTVTNSADASPESAAAVRTQQDIQALIGSMGLDKLKEIEEPVKSTQNAFEVTTPVDISVNPNE